jgi:hypothetical protein
VKTASASRQKAMTVDRGRLDLSMTETVQTAVCCDGGCRTLTGRKMEVPVRKILVGCPSDKAAGRHAMANPDSERVSQSPEPVPAREVS